jgi:hypothetical protein
METMLIIMSLLFWGTVIYLALKVARWLIRLSKIEINIVDKAADDRRKDNAINTSVFTKHLSLNPGIHEWGQNNIDLSSASVAPKPYSFNPANYELKKTLMTPTEKLFFEKIREAVGDKYDIYPQVNLDKIFKVKNNSDRSAFYSAKCSIDRKSIDFLITIRQNQRPFIGIELDDPSHLRKDRILRDEKVNSLFQDNGICLIRFEAKDTFTAIELRNLFEKYYQNISS